MRLSSVSGQAQFIGNNLTGTFGAIASGRLGALVVGTANGCPPCPACPPPRRRRSRRWRKITGWNALFGPPALAEPVADAWSCGPGGAGRASRMDHRDAPRRRHPRVLPPARTRDSLRGQVALYRDLARRLEAI
nr:hypothetical protein [Siccirubricoccus sp. G192]